MIVHRYNLAKGGYRWTNGKTEATSDARIEARSMPKGETVDVEAVELADVTNKRLIVRLLNQEEFLAVDDDGDEIAKLIVSIKGRAAARGVPVVKEVYKPKPVTGDKFECGDAPDDNADTEYVTIWSTNKGWRIARLKDLRKGDKVMNEKGGSVVW